jgi:LPS export ABC transporter protein LptC
MADGILSPLMFKGLSIRHLLGLAILILSGVLIAVLVSNQRERIPEETIATLPKDVDLSLHEIHYTETREGVRRWTLVADSAEHAVGDGVTHIENIRMTFFDMESHGDVLLTAREGNLYTETGEVEVLGDVVVVSPAGYSFYTDRARFYDADGEIRTEDAVRIVSETMELTGKGMRLSVRDHTFDLLADIKARWSAEEKQKG